MVMEVNGQEGGNCHQEVVVRYHRRTFQRSPISECQKLKLKTATQVLVISRPG